MRANWAARSESDSLKSAIWSRASSYNKLAQRVGDAPQALRDLASVTFRSGLVTRDLEAVAAGDALPPTKVATPTGTLRTMGVITSPSISDAAVAVAVRLGPHLERHHPRPRFAAPWPLAEVDELMRAGTSQSRGAAVN
jgi:hypothetical protein